MRVDPLTTHRKIQPVILCGGSGTRLWPLSRAHSPKQFLALTGERSLIEEALLRASRLEDAAIPILVAASRHEGLVRKALRNTGTGAVLILEPHARNTAPAVAAAALYTAARGQDAILLVIPADHLVEGDDEFRRSVEEAVDLAGQDWLTVLGILPHEPSSAFGYIMRGEALSASGSRVARFIEKPVTERAAELIAEGAFWNAGMVVAKAGVVIEALKRHEPQLVASVAASLDAAAKNENVIALAPDQFASATKISFDHAVLERHDRVAVSPFRAKWRDLGTWGEVMELYAPDGLGNRGKGDVRVVAGRDNFIFSPDRTVLALGIEDLVIVDSPDALLVAKREHLPLLGDAVKDLPENLCAVITVGETTRFPWGDAETVTVEARCTIRKFTIARGKATEASDHGLDAGHWIVISGSGAAIIGARTIALRAGQSAVTPAGVARHIQNTGDEPLQLIEVRFDASASDPGTIRKAV